MTPLGITVALGLLAGVWAQINVLHPQCDSPEVEEAALVAQDYINTHHPHGYKYALNRIEDIKIYTKPDGNSTYVLEVDLLETDCHVLDPTPVANCTVRPKMLTAVEGDCDVVLDKVGGVLTVTAYKCKTEESTEDICLGCPTLLPLNDTTALDFVQASLTTFNNMTVNTTYVVLEVGRMSSQVVSGGPMYSAEYIVAEANCTDVVCVPLVDSATGICTAKGFTADHTVDCKMFLTLNAARAVPPEVHTGNMSGHGLRHHKLTAISGPQQSLLSAESQESAEVVPVVVAAAAADPAAADPAAADPAAADPAAADPAAADPAAADPAAADPAAADPAAADPAAADPAAAAADPAVDTGSVSDSTSDEVPVVVVKRDVPASAAAETPAPLTDPIALVPVCPGRIRVF